MGDRKPYKYKIALFRNEEYVRTIEWYINGDNSAKIFKKMLENNNVTFPKTLHPKGNRYVKCEYEIKLLKIYEDGDKLRTVRDGLGRLVKEEILVNKWLVLDSSKWLIEEDFKVFDNDRMNFNQLYKFIENGLKGRGVYKHLLKLYNKILIYNESDFDVVICKTVKECDKLYQQLMVKATKSKIVGFIFGGSVSEYHLSTYYDMLRENTGWSNSYCYSKFDSNAIVKSDDQ